MAATQDIVATYTGPGRVVARLVGQGEQESRALVFLMLGCLMVFVAQTPRLAREAHLTDGDLPMMLGGTLMAWMFIVPLVFYAIAMVSHIVARAFGRKQTAYGARIALFWALLASSPVMLLWGLTAGFIGPGPQLSLVGFIWIAVFIWFWIGGLLGAGRAAL